MASVNDRSEHGRPNRLGQKQAIGRALHTLDDTPKAAVLAEARRMCAPLTPAEMEISTASICRFDHRSLGHVFRLRSAGLVRTDGDRWRLSRRGRAEVAKDLAGEPSAFSPGRASAGESPWHRGTVLLIGTPGRAVPGIDDRCRPVRVWVNSIFATGDRQRLWRQWGVARRPDVVFELAGGRFVVVEVEPDVSAYAGIEQVARYADLLRREGLERDQVWHVTAVLVVQSAARVKAMWGDLLAARRVVLVEVPE